MQMTKEDVKILKYQTSIRSGEKMQEFNIAGRVSMHRLVSGLLYTKMQAMREYYPACPKSSGS